MFIKKYPTYRFNINNFCFFLNAKLICSSTDSFPLSLNRRVFLIKNIKLDRYHLKSILSIASYINNLNFDL